MAVQLTWDVPPAADACCGHHSLLTHRSGSLALRLQEREHLRPFEGLAFACATLSSAWAAEL